MSNQIERDDAKPELTAAAEIARASAEALLREAVQAAPRRTPGAAPAPAPSMGPRAPAWVRERAARGAGLVVALAAGVVLGVGGLAAYHRLERVEQHRLSAAEWTRIAARLETSGTDGGRVASDLTFLKDQIAALREQSERGRSEANARAAQTAERLGQFQRTDKEAGERLSALSERLERLDKDAGARIAALGERLEKRLSATAATPVAAAPATLAPLADAAVRPVVAEDRTGSIPDPGKSKPPTLDAWILRDVFDGVAVVEGRNRRIVEVAPGETLPGGGRVEAIERRGKTWVVVTNKGVITSQAW